MKNSGSNYTLICPTGFFSDMEEYFKMAQKGRAQLFGNGKFKINPIHGKDLAKICVDSIEKDKKVIEAGGPEIFTDKEIVEKAFHIT
ncbi:MAG: SDR family NAD(P)-dependent oxidoreductase, partial [Flavobacteriales bacterium]